MKGRLAGCIGPVVEKGEYCQVMVGHVKCDSLDLFRGPCFADGR